ncbi:MAG TPA: hypothetical protein VHU19_00545 [Pyrinomonadaceae bacterium]|nr:hypothetical protein [Pyrinomonadaceae bacterium]
MKRVSAVSVPSLLATAFAFVIFLPALSASCRAQGGPGTVIVGPRVDSEAERIRDEQRREMQLRSVGTGAGRTDERAVKAAAEQLNQDFKRIQVIRNEIAHALNVEGVLDYKRITGQTAELKKRALRMQGYLALRGAEAGPDGKEQAAANELDEGQMKGALVRLCKRIDSFVANPKFTSPDVLNVEGSAKAGRDLREIITLSDDIRSGAERLGRKDK